MIYVGQLSNPWMGYTQAGLNYLMAAVKAGIDFNILPLGGPVGVKGWDSLPPWAYPVRMASGATGVSRAVALLHYTPDALADTKFPKPGTKNIGLTVTETDIIPRWIAKGMERNLDGLIVPTEWNARAFKDSGFGGPIEVVPHCIGEWWWNSQPVVSKDPEKLVYYYIGGWNPRKAPVDVLRAYLNAFPEPNGKTVLAMKVTGSASLLPYVDQMCRDKRGVGLDECEDINFWCETWSEGQIRWLHSIGDVYVSAHRGEGWGLGLHQAKLLNKRVIYTGWSAPTEFLGEQHGDIPVDHTMVPVSGMDQHRHFDTMDDEVLRWAQPEMDDLVDALYFALKTYEASGPEGFPAFSETELQAYRNTYSWETVGAQLRTALGSF